MATYPLVGIKNDLGPLVELSLEHHGIRVDAVFDVFDAFDEGASGQYVAIATPLLREEGSRATYIKIFNALKEETFSTTTFLRLHTLLLSPEEFQIIKRELKKNVTVNFHKLGHLNDVVIRQTEDPKLVMKTGILRVLHLAGEGYLISFGQLGSSGALKTRTVTTLNGLRKILLSFGIAINPISEGSSFSVVGTSSLENVYKQGLI